jgi:hypothetical protein
MTRARGHKQRRIEPARGEFSPGRSTLRVAIAFDEETFGRIRRLAVANEVSFGEQVRRLVNTALTPLSGGAA